MSRPCSKDHEQVRAHYPALSGGDSRVSGPMPLACSLSAGASSHGCADGVRDGRMHVALPPAGPDAFATQRVLEHARRAAALIQHRRPRTVDAASIGERAAAVTRTVRRNIRTTEARRG